MTNPRIRRKVKNREIAIRKQIEEEEEFQKCIEEEAYFLWEKEGKQEGKSDYYWKIALEKVKAEKISPIYKRLCFLYKCYYFVERIFLEPTNGWLNRQALFDILGKLGNLTIVVGIITFIGGEKVRRNNEIFAAWQTIEQQSGSRGRIEALQFLNSRPLKFPWIGWTDKRYYQGNKGCVLKRLLGLRWEAETLEKLSIEGDALLSGIRLCNANLRGAKLENTILKKAHLDSANLSFATLIKADLSLANLNFANLRGADLRAAINLNPKQIESACYWEEANFDWDFRKLLKKALTRKLIVKNGKALNNYLQSELSIVP